MRTGPNKGAGRGRGRLSETRVQGRGTSRKEGGRLTLHTHGCTHTHACVPHTNTRRHKERFAESESKIALGTMCLLLLSLYYFFVYVNEEDSRCEL